MTNEGLINSMLSKCSVDAIPYPKHNHFPLHLPRIKTEIQMYILYDKHYN